MADDNNSLTVSVAPEGMTTRVSVDGKGAIGQSVTSGDSLKLNTADEAVEKDLAALEAEDGDEPEPTVTPPEADKPEGEPEAEPAADLPDYDPENEEVHAAYEAKYLHEVDGKTQLNLNAFNASLEANLAEGKVDIAKGEREFLKGFFGIDDDAISTYLEGRVKKANEQREALHAIVGGEEALNSMLSWGRDGGYTKEQQEAFNAALAQGGEATETALALLKSRFERSGQKLTPPKDAPKPKLGVRSRLPSSPARKVNSVPTVPKATEPFADSEAHRVAMLEAGDDPVKMEAVRKRLRASPWFGK